MKLKRNLAFYHTHTNKYIITPTVVKYIHKYASTKAIMTEHKKRDKKKTNEDRTKRI